MGALRTVCLAMVLAAGATASYAQTTLPMVLTCQQRDGHRATLSVDATGMNVTLQLFPLPEGTPAAPPIPGTVTDVAGGEIAMLFPTGFDPAIPNAAKWYIDTGTLALTQISNPGNDYACQVR